MHTTIATVSFAALAGVAVQTIGRGVFRSAAANGRHQK
jgi:hypothetical protein